MGVSVPFEAVVMDFKTPVNKQEQEREDLRQFERFFIGSSDMMSLLDESLTCRQPSNGLWKLAGP